MEHATLAFNIVIIILLVGVGFLICWIGGYILSVLFGIISEICTGTIELIKQSNKQK